MSDIEKDPKKIAVDAFLVTMKWCLIVFVVINMIWGALVWNLHNKTFGIGKKSVDIVQDGHATNNNISNNKF